VQAHPKSFDLSKILKNQGKISTKFLKIRAKMGPNVCRKTQKHMKTFFGGHTKKGQFVGICRTKTFQASFGKFEQKSFTPQNLPVPAPKHAFHFVL